MAELNDTALETIIAGVIAGLRDYAPRRYYTPPQVARLLGVKADKVLTWIRRGELAAINVADDRLTRPRYRVEPAALDAFKLRRTVTLPQKAQRSRRPKLPPGMIPFYSKPTDEPRPSLA